MIIHENVYEEVKSRLASAYSKLVIGNPLDEKNHVGPVIDHEAVEMYVAATKKVMKEGGKLLLKAGFWMGKGLSLDAT